MKIPRVARHRDLGEKFGVMSADPRKGHYGQDELAALVAPRDDKYLGWEV